MPAEKQSTACRIYVALASQAPVALVLRRGPSNWWHLLQWDLVNLALTPGAWFRGTLYPRRCDISPDGRLFGYYALKSTIRTIGWPDTYFAISKTPWLEALAAWNTLGTWTWGCEFSSSGALRVHGCMETKPFYGAYQHPIAFEPMSIDWPKRDIFNELKRGWVLASDDDPWRASVPGEPNLLLRRAQPGNNHKKAVTLGLLHHGVDFKRRGIEGAQLEYFLQDGPGDVAPLPDLDWADWDHQGRLLRATSTGTLEVCRCRGTKLERVWTQTIRDLTPHPEPAPAWATHW